MPEIYRCEDCGSECREPIYVRLHLTRNGWSRMSGQRRWQASVPIGRFCVACLVKRVRTATGSEQAATDLRSRLRA